MRAHAVKRIGSTRWGNGLRRIAIWAVALAMLLTLRAGMPAYAENRPAEAAASIAETASMETAAPDTGAISMPAATAARTDNPLITPLRYQPLPQSGQTRLTNTLNILLLGFDAEHKFYAENGGDSHTDAMMLLSVNTETNAISLISLPRDTLTYVPGVRGIYKLNGAVNAGGGKTDAGFRCAMEAASALLGNIPIDYYFGLNMEKVAEVGDLLGGVDVEVTVAFTTESGRRITTGRKHLDGEAIYSYMRARKSAEGTDKSRTKRQRAVIAAMLQKIQQERLYWQIPQVLAATRDGFYTNMTAATLLRLLPAAMYADTDDIRLYTVEGTLRTALNGWNMLFIDQAARQEMLEAVFGIAAEPVPYVSYAYTGWLVGDGTAGSGAFSAIRCLYVAEHVLAYAAEVSDATEAHPEARQTVADLCAQVKTLFCITADAVMQASGKYTADRNATDWNDALLDGRRRLQAAVTVLAEQCGFPGTSGLDALGNGDMCWAYKTRWETDSAINSVYVNFR